MPRHFHNQSTTASGALSSKERARLDFSRNLYQAMAKKGWNQTELAREAAKHLPEGKTIGRDAMSLYIAGKVLPRAAVLQAIADALGVETTDLLPPQAAPSAMGTIAPPLDVQEAGGGDAWLRINQRVPWPVALEIMQLLKGFRNE